MKELSVEDRFKDFEENLSRLFLAYNSLKDEIKEKSEEINQLKSMLVDFSEKTKELNEKNKRLKLAGALQGNADHKQLMKVRLNKLIHEVDICMKQVTGL